MSEWLDANVRSFIAGGAFAQHLRVKLTAGKLAVAGLADRDLGTLRVATFADGDDVGVILRNKNGTVIMVASKAIALGDEVFTAAGGKVSNVQGSGAFRKGTALQAAAADGDLIEVLPHAGAEVAGA